MSAAISQQPAPDLGEPWQNELGDFEIYPRTGGDAIAYAEGAKTRDRVIACVNACRGMTDPAAEIQALREAIKEAHYALAYVYNHGEGSCTFPYRTDDDLCSENRFYHVKDALDSLKPFLP